MNKKCMNFQEARWDWQASIQQTRKTEYLES